MRIIVFSDSHAIGSPSVWYSFFDKRAIGIFNHHYFRKHKKGIGLLKKFVQTVPSLKPDIVICTGDISTSSEPSEFEITCKILEPLVKNNSFEFRYVPGNHDYYVNDSFCIKSMEKTFEYLNRGKQTFKDLPYCLDMQELNFCFINPCKPRNIMLSIGKIDTKTEEFVINWANSQTINKPKVLVSHYPLIEDHPVKRFRHKLYGEKNILKELISGKIDLSICGHVHCPTPRINDLGRGEIVVGSITRNECFAMIDYNTKLDVFSYKKMIP